jgi:hypothetical protein
LPNHLFQLGPLTAVVFNSTTEEEATQGAAEPMRTVAALA